MSEILSVSQYIVDVLKNNAAVAAKVGTRIYPDVAPATTTFPFIIYGFSAYRGTDVVGGKEKLSGNYVYTVKTVSKSSSPKESGDIAVLVTKALQDAPQKSFGGNWVQMSRRLDMLSFSENVGDVAYFHIGSRFEFFVYEV